MKGSGSVTADAGVKIDVVVPALDEAEGITAALEACFAGAGASTLDVIVVDGGSRDATRESARAGGARVVDSAPGRARQLQTGLESTGGEIVVFLHADTCLPPSWADAMLRALGRPGCAGGAFDFAFAGPVDGALALVERGARLRSRWLGLPYGDQALFAPRAVLDAIGGVPQSPWMEDLDLVARLRRCGRLALVPLAARTSSRRHRRDGVWRTALRHAAAAVGWQLGAPRAALRTWVSR